MHSLLHPRPFLRTLLVLLALAVVLAAGHGVYAGGIVYVVPGGAGTGDGSSWANAKDLAAALAAANSGDELWVKTGIYKPNTTGLVNPRTATFTLKNGVAVYGGFAGNETQRSGRNPTANVTTLSGDLLGNDTPNTPATLTDNAYHVVTADSVDATSILDGFTITGGVASDTSGTFFGRTGGGIVSNIADATFRNLIITGNSAQANGGGMYTYYGSPTLTNVVLNGNTSSQGGGMFINGRTPSLTNVTFRSNTASYGGGLVVFESNAMLTNAVFKLNEAYTGGGGLYITNFANPTLTNAVFDNNQGDYQGGGLHADTMSKPTLYNAVFIGNISQNGGGMSSQGSQVNLVNATFNGNAASQGGAVYTDNNGSSSSDVPTLTSSLLWGNDASTGPEIYNNRGSASVSYSIVQGGYTGMGNLNADPKFISPVDPNTNNTTNANMRLQPTSPAINVGDPNAAIPPLPATDPDGNGRIAGGRVDMGAYEVQTLDTTPPDTSLSTTPADPTNSTSASFIFTGADNLTPAASLTFQCSLDNAPFTACASPQPYNGLSNSSHTFQVRAVDAFGNADPSPASFTWLVSTTPPTTSLPPNTTPPNTSSPSVSFTFTGSGATPSTSNLTFQCSLDNAPFTACTSPKTYSGLSAGLHTFQVRAVDNAGNVDPSPPTFTWTVDAAPPMATILTKPANPTNSASATFTFSGQDDVTPAASLTFECSLDNAPFAACASPQAYGGLTDGSHTFQVRATDAVGNIGNPTGFTWTVDTTPPTVTRNTTLDACSVPGANGWCRGTQTAGFSASDAGSGVVSPCSGAACSFTQTSAANGSAVSIASGQLCDAAGNCASGISAGPFKIDSAAPTASITTPASGATYTLGAAVNAAYTCADTGGSGVAACSGTVASGSAIDTSSVGPKTFTVTVTDNAGNQGSAQVGYTVAYSWSGFFSPVSLPPTVNSAKAGSAVPLKFSLGGNQGLAIFAAGSPSSQQVNCDNGAPVNVVEQTVTAGASGLQYDPSTGQYTYVWKTQSAWSGQCRQLSIKLVDGSTHVANFKFK